MYNYFLPVCAGMLFKNKMETHHLILIFSNQQVFLFHISELTYSVDGNYFNYIYG